MSTQATKRAFPFSLHDILEQAEQQGYDDIISWTPCGTALMVHRRDAFISRQFFKLTKYKSFSRQLNLWGFTCIKTGIYHGAYAHPSFLRGNRDGCRRIVRQKKNKTSKTARASTTATTTRRPMETTETTTRRPMMAMETTAQELPVNPLVGGTAATPAASSSSDITRRINKANALITSDILNYMAQLPDISHPQTASSPSIETPLTAPLHGRAKDFDMNGEDNNNDWVEDLFALSSNDDFFTSSLDDFCFHDLEIEGLDLEGMELTL